MTNYLIDSPITLAKHIGQGRDLWQLKENDSGESGWQQSAPETFSALRSPDAMESAKQFFFAPRENIFQFDGNQFRESLPAPAPFALVGISSCDLTAIAYQDRFFRDDPHYQARRQQALLVGYECLSPCAQGFCPSVDAGPGTRAGSADLSLHQLQEDQWLLRVLSDTGKKALEGLVLEKAGNSAHTQRDRQLQACIDAFPDDSHIHAGIEAINSNSVAQETWDAAGIQCLSCSGCTTLCPTCSCYGTADHTTGDTVIRERFWDSCLYDGFQREASHNNPAGAAGDRVRRFWYHKFSREFFQATGSPDAVDRYGCVGCGRCEITCPGVIGVHSMMKKITE